MTIELQGFWLSLWGRTPESSTIVELQTDQPWKFLPPGTFRKSGKGFEAYNIRSVTVELMAKYLPFILYSVGLAVAPKASESTCTHLHLPPGGLNITAGQDSPAKPLTLRFPVGSLIYKTFDREPWQLNEALIATQVPRFTAEGWCRRTFHYDDPARVFQASAIVYRDQQDRIVFVEEFNRQGDDIVTERFSLQ